MNKTSKRTTRWLSLLLCTVLIAAMALMAMGCDTQKTDGEPTPEVPATTPDTTSESTSESPEETRAVRGEGETVFYFDVVGKDGDTTRFEIRTDSETVGEALLAAGLIEGDEGPYGLYVKTVNGETHVYEEDKMYWAFYVDGSYAAKGVSETAVEAGKTYAFKAEK